MSSAATCVLWWSVLVGEALDVVLMRLTRRIERLPSEALIDELVLTSGEIAAIYRLDKKDVIAECAAGLVPATPRRMRGGRDGYLVRLKDARERWASGAQG